MWNAEEVKFVEVGNLDTGFRLCRKPLSSDKKRNYEKYYFWMWCHHDFKTSKLSYDTQPGVVINRAKFDHSKSNSFGGVKTQTHAHTTPPTELNFKL